MISHHHAQQPLVLSLVEDVREVALATVLAVVHGSHENTGTTLDPGGLAHAPSNKIKVTYTLLRALATQALDLAITVDLVVLEHSELDPARSQSDRSSQ